MTRKSARRAKVIAAVFASAIVMALVMALAESRVGAQEAEEGLQYLLELRERVKKEIATPIKADAPTAVYTRRVLLKLEVLMQQLKAVIAKHADVLTPAEERAQFSKGRAGLIISSVLGVLDKGRPDVARELLNHRDFDKDLSAGERDALLLRIKREENRIAARSRAERRPASTQADLLERLERLELRVDRLEDLESVEALENPTRLERLKRLEENLERLREDLEQHRILGHMGFR